MKISFNWLKQFINIDLDSNKTAELLTDLGLEVEGITPFESVKGGLQGVVVGHVLSCEKHPNADKLKVTTVDIGKENPIQIVCGAPNVEAGQKVPVATIGTTLYTKEGESWEIKKGKIRGEESYGMICAEDELGIGESHDGIMVLPKELVPGTACATIFEIENDEVFEIGLTPNRADAMSHFGVARDLKAGLKHNEIEIELITPPLTNFKVDSRSLKLDVLVDNNELSPRYAGVTISNLSIKPSPDWLQNRLKAIGITPKNNVVDATNYVLHELGQPLHAFDTKKIKGDKIVVKTLAQGTKFTTLDGIERELHQEDLMICDAEKPLCIAGVLGGLESGVTENTTSIFLESAYFNSVSVRKTAKRHGLNTDASFRFERGIDIENVEYSLKRAALLILEIAGGEITSDIVDLYPNKAKDFEVFVPFQKIHQLIGQQIPRDTIKSILTSLDIKVKSVTEAGLGLEVPTYRVDVQRPVDVIEEILRVYGYNNIEFTQKLNASIAVSSKFDDLKIQDIIGNTLASKGFYEIMTNSLTSPEYSALSDTIQEENAVKIINPLSADLSVLRQSPLFSALEVASHNINRKQANLQLFEFGKTYTQKNGAREESKYLSLLISGNRSNQNWIENPPKKSDFFFLKSIVELVIERLGIANVKTLPIDNTDYAEGLTYQVKGQTMVEFGIVKKHLTKKLEVKQEVLFANFNWDLVLKIASNNKIVFKEISKYPEVKRDFALLLEDSITFKQIYDIAFQTEKKILKKVNLFDVYTGKKLAAGKKSYAVSFTLQNSNSTLTDKQIDKIMNKLKYRFEKDLNAELR